VRRRFDDLVAEVARGSCSGSQSRQARAANGKEKPTALDNLEASMFAVAELKGSIKDR
jgi:hypothetical protein